MIRKLMLAIGAAALLVAMAVPAFAQDGLDLLNPEANAANFGKADFGDQNADATLVCGNAVADIDINQSNSQSADQSGSTNVGSIQAIEQNATQTNTANVSVSQSVNDVTCVAVQEQEQEFEQDAEANAANLIFLLFGGGPGGP